jgi:hypothetical protein
MVTQYLDKFKEGKWRLSDIITSDEWWFYHNKIGMKKSHMSSVAEGEKSRKVVKIDRFEPKTLFTVYMGTSDVVHIPYLKPGETAIHQTYLKSSLRPFVQTLNEQRPQCVTKISNFTIATLKLILVRA